MCLEISCEEVFDVRGKTVGNSAYVIVSNRGYDAKLVQYGLTLRINATNDLQWPKHTSPRDPIYGFTNRLG